MAEVAEYNIDLNSPVSLEKMKGIGIHNVDIDNKIHNISYLFMGTLTLCVVELKNGFRSVGKSAPIDPDNYSKESGMEWAFQDACKEIIDHEVYNLYKKNNS